MKKSLSALSALLLSFMMLFAGMIPASAEGEDFDTFLENKWKEMMEADYSTMHFSVKDYKSMGIEKPEVTLGEVSYEYFQKLVEDDKKSLEELHTYDYDSLDDRQQHDYLIYERSLEYDIALNQYPQYVEMFNPYNGVLTNTIPAFTEYVFYADEDFEDYLTLVADLPRYLDDMMTFTKQQAADGYFMRDTALDEQLEEMDEFVVKGEENPLIIIFNNSVDAYEGLSDEQKTEYKARNKDLVLNEVLPAYKKTIEELGKLRGSRSIGNAPLCNYSDGKEYYAELLKMKTSSLENPQAVFDYLNKFTKDSIQYLMDASLSLMGEAKNDNGPKDANGISLISEVQTPQEILDYLQSHLEGFPKGPEVVYTPSYLDPSVANPSVGAYYVTTPIDDLKNNVIRINGENTGDDINKLYYTLAHEGFPGHLYQFTWYYNQKFNPIRHDLNMIGYSEGWAQYVEKIMVNRAPINAYSQELVSINTYFAYGLQAACDVAVNGLGYDEKALEAYLKENVPGMTNDDGAITELYNAVADQPAMIVPYGYGLAKHWELRERVQSALGNEFDLEEYHLQVLTNGMRPFELLESDLEKYVESKGKKMSKDFTFFQSERGDKIKSAGGIVSFVSKYGIFIVLGVAILLVVLLVLIIIGIIKLIKKLTSKN